MDDPAVDDSDVAQAAPDSPDLQLQAFSKKRTMSRALSMTGIVDDLVIECDTIDEDALSEQSQHDAPSSHEASAGAQPAAVHNKLEGAHLHHERFVSTLQVCDIDCNI